MVNCEKQETEPWHWISVLLFLFGEPRGVVYLFPDSLSSENEVVALMYPFSSNSLDGMT